MKFSNLNYFIFLLILGLFFSCKKNEVQKANFDALIAPDAVMLIHFDDYKKWNENINKQSFLSKQKSNPFQDFLSIKAFQNIIELPEEMLLSYNILGKNEPMKTLVFKVNANDSLKLNSKTSYEYDTYRINEIEHNDEKYFSASIGDYNVLSQSNIILENIIRNFTNKISGPEDTHKLLDGLSDDSPSMVINTKLFSKLSTTFFSNAFPKEYLSLSDYLGFDLKFDENKIFFSGIAFEPKDNKDWSIFKKVKADESLVQEVIPNQFVSAKSLIISDYYKLYPTNQATEKPKEKDSLLINIKEVSEVEFVDGYAKVFLSKNIEQTFESLKVISKPKDEFSSFQIHELSSSAILSNLMKPFLKNVELNFFVIYNDFVIASNKIETLENIIIQINNENVLIKDPNYNNHLESLYGKSHMIWFTNTTKQSSFIDDKIKEDYKDGFKKLDWKDHELIVSQLIVEDNFAYLNILQKEKPENENKSVVSQQIRLKHEKDLISKPQFFKNWRTGQHDVVYQDIKNKLYLKDTKGNLIWSKQLDSRIVGKIFTIDIYQNGRLQMAFSTKNNIYIIDKNGSDVSPFPLKVKDEVTQSLSVFDYDKNGKYRFIVVMDNKVRMYDKTGKRVRGFKFNRAKNTIAYPIEHVRMGNKDYILAQETSGVLNILNRRGKERIKLPKDFKHTENKWFEHKGKFVSVNDKGNILEIDQNGKLNTIKKEWLNPKFDITEKHFAEMSENELVIDDKNLELPFGLYTEPIIMNNHVAIADLQTQKVYVSDFQGNLLSGFPTFGKRISDYYYSSNFLYLLCQDEDGALLVYKTRYK